MVTKIYTVTEIDTRIDTFSKEDSNIVVSPQAKSIMTRYKDFPLEHFLSWSKKYYLNIGGEMLFRYIQADDGLQDGTK